MKKIIGLVCLCLLWSLLSCNFGDTNLDPIRPNNAELKEILPAALTQTTHNLGSIGGRVTGIVVQHFKGIDAQPESYTQYLIDERTLDPFWRTGLYAGAMKDCHLLIIKAEEEERFYYGGIAKILMAINLGIATSFWGEVPFAEAFSGLENLQPIYDSQVVIYGTIQQLLSSAIEDLHNQPSENPPGEEDLIFSGDPSKWIATAKALQARYYLHLSKRRADAAQKALSAIQSGAFEILEEQADFPFRTNLNEANPLPLYSFERPGQIVISDYLYQLLDAMNDPRLSRMAVESDGLQLIYKQDELALYWGQFDAPLPLISLAELKFIEAEAQLRLGQIDTAEITFRKAVISHFEQLNIPYSEYEPYLDAYVHFEDCLSLEGKLERLIQQKHIALFGQNAIEAWVDYRRTGYPDLSAPPNANSSLNPSLVIPKRYLYPISERTSNEQNLNAAIIRQGGHLMDVELWAF